MSLYHEYIAYEYNLSLGILLTLVLLKLNFHGNGLCNATVVAAIPTR